MSFIANESSLVHYRPLRLPTDSCVSLESGSHISRAELIDVSSTGARLSGLAPLPADAQVTLHKLDRRFPAEVVRSDEHHVALRFARPLSDTDVNLLRGVGGGKQSWSASQRSFREMT